MPRLPAGADTSGLPTASACCLLQAAAQRSHVDCPAGGLAFLDVLAFALDMGKDGFGNMPQLTVTDYVGIKDIKWPTGWCCFALHTF